MTQKNAEEVAPFICRCKHRRADHTGMGSVTREVGLLRLPVQSMAT